MADTRQINGPAKGIIHLAEKIIFILIKIIETRIRLGIVELEAERANIIQMLLMIGLTLLFTTFGLASCLVLLILSVNIKYSVIIVSSTACLFFVCAFCLSVWVFQKSRESRLLIYSLRELREDQELMKK
ncbi:phage holin family protein [Candidatus Ishikawella capsulata]|uniref:Conserved inner membrane protein n=1 Tax=Candidatus Ishikawaella capsulata Mpkobe TaxID=476281 RepID=C5WDL5_9ENTR|nr:phage holin family protein [Candidatus Ishikawaella capsulata]BAH83421.1 conserved inner membrane protein [Candidatus Ishikawaella capsulata Mpkobe]